MSSPGPAIRCRSFRVPRRGHGVEECEDACAAEVTRGRFAVADGAAESAFSGLWARLLVDEFVHGPQEAIWPDWIVPLQKRWADSVRLPADAGPLPWYLEDRYDQGAFATFLGLSVGGSGWQALAVGDSCLFHVREAALRVAFPLTHSAQFGNSPWLVGSRTPADAVPLQRAAHLTGDCRPGDSLWLMTDALARWFLTATERGEQPWRFLEELVNEPEGHFADWVARRRDDRLLRNDDTTLIAVHL
jgi:hypothetical protein